MRPKIILIVFMACALCMESRAQIQKKDLLLGGNIGYNYNASGNYVVSNVNFVPHIGYAVGNNSVIELNFSLGYSTQKNTQSFSSSISKSDNFDFSTILFYRKYFVIKGNLGWYAGFYAQAGIIKTTDYDSTGAKTSSDKNWSLGLGVVPGIYYQALPTLQVFADFGGINYRYTVSGDNMHTNSIGLSFLNSFNFGVDFIIRKKQ